MNYIKPNNLTVMLARFKHKKLIIFGKYLILFKSKSSKDIGDIVGKNPEMFLS